MCASKTDWDVEAYRDPELASAFSKRVGDPRRLMQPKSTSYTRSTGSWIRSNHQGKKIGFVSACGRQSGGVLEILDDFNGEGLTIQIGFSLPAEHVVRILDQIIR